MAEFKSDETTINVSAQKVYSKLSDLENIRSYIDKIPEDNIPEDKLEQFRSLEITSDSISVKGGPTGSIKMNITKKVEPSLIRLEAADIPLSIALEVHIKEISENQCSQQVVIIADIPIFLKPMVSGPLQKVVDQFSAVLGVIPFND